MKQVLSHIHARFRQLRNGEVADNLAAQGVRYRLAWGVESYRLKAIADEVKAAIAEEDKLKAIAEYLLNEDVRESRMLATRLYPVGMMTKEDAEQWAENIVYTEQADQACMNLFAKVPFAKELVERWISCNDIRLYMALQIALRLNMTDDRILQRAKKIVEEASFPIWIRSMANNLL